jgi:hypothetical protein
LWLPQVLCHASFKSSFPFSLVFFSGYDQCCLFNSENEARITQNEPYRDLAAKESRFASNISSLKAVEKKKAAGKKPQVCIASLF